METATYRPAAAISSHGHRTKNWATETAAPSTAMTTSVRRIGSRAYTSTYEAPWNRSPVR